MLSFARTIRPSKPGFRKWLDLEKLKQDLLEGSKDEGFPDRVFAYISTALGLPVKKLERMGWKDSVSKLYEAYTQFTPQDIPIINGAPKEAKPVDWDYDGRGWFFYSHTLSKAYGWTLEYIAELDVNEALGHLQEILTDEQLEKEFYHGLSEVAYKYDKSTKKSSYVPMKRPYWMRPAAPKEIKKVRIKKSLLPMGVIKSIHGLPEEFSLVETEKINPPRDSQAL